MPIMCHLFVILGPGDRTANHAVGIFCPWEAYICRNGKELAPKPCSLRSVKMSQCGKEEFSWKILLENVISMCVGQERLGYVMITNIHRWLRGGMCDSVTDLVLQELENLGRKKINMNTYRPQGVEEMAEGHLEERVTAFLDQGLWEGECTEESLTRGRVEAENRRTHASPHVPSQLSFPPARLWRESRSKLEMKE